MQILKCLVFGTSGQVATALQQIADVTALSRADVDLEKPEMCKNAILERKPDLVINAAAYTAVDKAEDEEGAALKVNGDAPTAMAKACAALNIPLVHISTDYVFNGSGETAWETGAATGPLGAYGRTKLAGEIGVRAAGGPHAIVRTSWVFSETGANFVKTMLRVGESRSSLNVVDDQIGGPTDALEIAQTCLEIGRQLMQNPTKSGTYHLAGHPNVSWAEFARSIFKEAGMSTQVQGIPASEYPTPAARPSNSRLDCSTLSDVFGIEVASWETGLSRVIATINKV